LKNHVSQKAVKIHVSALHDCLAIVSDDLLTYMFHTAANTQHIQAVCG